MKKIYVLLSVFSAMSLYSSQEESRKDIKIPVKTYSYSTVGKRKTKEKQPSQEDRVVATKIEHNDKKFYCTGIFDGHGGEEVAQLASEKFFNFFENHLKENNSIDECLEYACAQCEELTKKKEYEYCGSTVLASCYDDDAKKLWLLSLGDSQAAVSNSCNHSLLTVAHRPIEPAEDARIRKFNEENRSDIIVDKNGMLKGWIGLSRSLGDAFCKTEIPVLIAQPECQTWDVYREFEDQGHICEGFAIFATDGFWDVIKKEKKEDKAFNWLGDAVNLSHEEFYTQYPNGYGATRNDIQDNALASSSSSTEDDSDGRSLDEGYEVNLAQRLVYIAVSHLGSTDNTTVVVQLFGRDPWLFDSDGTSSAEDSSDGRPTKGMPNTENLDDALAVLNNFSGDGSAGSDTKSVAEQTGEEQKKGNGEQDLREECGEFVKNDVEKVLDQLDRIDKYERYGPLSGDVAKQPKEKQEEQKVQIVNVGEQKAVQVGAEQGETSSIGQSHSKTKYSIWTSIHKNYHYICGGGMVLVLAALMAWCYSHPPISFVAG